MFTREKLENIENELIDINSNIVASTTLSNVNISQINGNSVQSGFGGAINGTIRVALANDQTVIGAQAYTNLTGIGGNPVSYNSGPIDAGCQRVVLANGPGTTMGSINVDQFGTNNVNTNSGISLPGTLRVVHASDVNAPVNQNQINGVAVSVNSGTNDNGTQRVTIATNQATLNTFDSNAGDLITDVITQTSTIAGAVNLGKMVVKTTGTDYVSNNLVQVAGSAISLGQKTMANSLPVVISSDQNPLFIIMNGTLQSSIYYISSGWSITAAATYIKPTGFAATNIGAPANVSTAQTWYVYSSNAGDTQEVYIEGYDYSGTKITETATLNGTTVVTLANTYTGFTWFGAKGAATFAGNIFLSEQNSNAGARAYCTISSGATTLKAPIGVIAIPSGKTLYILNLSTKRLTGNSIHRLNMRKTNENSVTAISAGTSNMLVDSWALINNNNYVKNGFRVPNNNTFVEYVWFEAVGSGVDTSENWIDVQFQLI